MIGFRTLTAHQYRELDLNIVETVILERLDDWLSYAEAVRLVMAHDNP